MLRPLAKVLYRIRATGSLLGLVLTAIVVQPMAPWSDIMGPSERAARYNLFIFLRIHGDKNRVNA